MKTYSTTYNGTRYTATHAGKGLWRVLSDYSYTTMILSASSAIEAIIKAGR